MTCTTLCIFSQYAIKNVACKPAFINISVYRLISVLFPSILFLHNCIYKPLHDSPNQLPPFHRTRPLNSLTNTPLTPTTVDLESTKCLVFSRPQQVRHAEVSVRIISGLLETLWWPYGDICLPERELTQKRIDRSTRASRMNNGTDAFSAPTPLQVSDSWLLLGVRGLDNG